MKIILVLCLWVSQATNRCLLITHSMRGPLIRKERGGGGHPGQGMTSRGKKIPCVPTGMVGERVWVTAIIGSQYMGHCNIGAYYNFGSQYLGHCNIGSQYMGHCNIGSQYMGDCNIGSQYMGHIAILGHIT